ncbi:unnamed protein product, partial [Prorocentrum cordatum]
MAHAVVGPWTGPGIDALCAERASWSIGDVLEVELWHEQFGDSCGTGVVEVIGHGPRTRLFEARVLDVEDQYHHWWIFQSQKAENPGLFRATAGKGDDDETVFRGREITPVYKWRVLNGSGLEADLAVVGWLSEQRRKGILDELRGRHAAAGALGTRAADGPGDQATCGASKPAWDGVVTLRLHASARSARTIRSLQLMADKVGREGEAHAWEKNDTPAAAKSYYLRVLQPLTGAGLRNNREMATLCAALDHLARGRTAFAADVLTMRLKAVEMASRHGNWDRAQFLELVEKDDTTLTTMGKEQMATQELAMQRKLESRGKGHGFDNEWRNSGNAPGSSGKGAKDKNGRQHKGIGEGREGQEGERSVGQRACATPASTRSPVAGDAARTPGWTPACRTSFAAELGSAQILAEWQAALR